MLRIEAPLVEKIHFIGEKLPLMDFSYEGSMLNLAVQLRNLKLIDSTVFHRGNSLETPMFGFCPLFTPMFRNSRLHPNVSVLSSFHPDASIA